MGCRKHGVESAATKAGAVLFWIAAWQLASMAVGSEFVLAGPLDAVAALARLLPSAEFWRSVAFSLIRIVGGCASAYLLAVPLALACICELVALRALDASWPAFARLALRFRRRASDQPRPSGPSARAGAPVFSAASLACGHDGAIACGPFDFTLRPGDIACAEGPSGAGKTTLLDTIAGELAPLSGEAVRKAATVARVYQDTRLVEDLSAIDNLLLVAPADFSSSSARERLEELLPAGAADVPVKRLSGGQRRRVELARALAAPSDLVLLDEPFTGLDPRARDLARAHILSHMHGKAVLISAHDAAALDLPVAVTIPVRRAQGIVSHPPRLG